MKFAGMIRLAVVGMLVLTSCTQSEPIAFERQTIKIGGSSEAYKMMEIFTDAYAAETNTVEFKFLQPSQTSGGVQGVKDGVIDIGLTSRELTESEQDGTIQYRAIARSPMLLATHESVSSVKNLTTEQINGIYSGKIKNWQELGGPNAEIIVLDLPEDKAEKKLLRKHYLGNLKITDRAILFLEEYQLIQGLVATPYSIGVVAKGEELSEEYMHILNLDGSSASLENITQGKYKLLYTIGVVFSKQPNPATQDFLNYFFRELSQEKLAPYGYLLIQ